jgi:hypothetical protein
VFERGSYYFLYSVIVVDEQRAWKNKVQKYNEPECRNCEHGLEHVVSAKVIRRVGDGVPGI